MKIKGSVALVTGANRGLGAAFARGLLAEGAAKVYAAARSDFESDVPGLVPIRLDITDAEQVAKAAAELTDVNLVVNNAGVAHLIEALDPGLEAAMRADLETNVFGTLRVAQAFAPVLAAAGGGALVNILSTASWHTLPGFSAYAPSKAAEWLLTDNLRLSLRPNGTQVVGVHVGFIDTDLAAPFDGPKSTPEFVVAQVLAGIDNGDEEVLVDQFAQYVKGSLATPVAARYPIG